MSLEKSNHADGSSAKLEPSSSSMVNLDEAELLIEGSEAVEVMARKRSSTSVGGAVRSESDPLEVPDYLKIQPSDIETVRRIGDAGATAKVYEAIWSRCLCAVKKFGRVYNRELVSIVQQEVNFLIGLRHPHVVRLMGLSLDSHQRCSIVMELMSKSLRGLIDSRIEQEKKRRLVIKKRNIDSTPIVPFTLPEAVDIITKIALGMWFLHTMEVSLRDLKSANVLVQLVDIGHGDAITEVKIGDFGFSLNLESRSRVMWALAFGGHQKSYDSQKTSP